MVMVNKIEEQLVSLRENVAVLETQYNNLKDQMDIDVKEAVEPLFKMHGILEYDCYLVVADNYFVIKRDKINTTKIFYTEELINLRLDDNLIYKSFYSTTDNSRFEFERMVIIGRMGELVLESGDDFIARYNKVRDSYRSTEKEIRDNIYSTQRTIRDVENSLKKAKEDEFIGMLYNGVEFDRDTFVSLQVRSNKTADITYLQILNTKGKSAYIKYTNRYNNMSYNETVRYTYILDFVNSKSYRNAIKTQEEVSF